MKKPLYVKLENQEEYNDTLNEIQDILRKLDSKFDKIKEIRQKEKEYLDVWEEKSETIREKLKDASKTLSLNK